MAALTANNDIALSGDDLFEVRLAVSTTMYAGSMAVMDRATGFAKGADDTSRLFPLGHQSTVIESDSSGNEITDFIAGGGNSTGTREALLDIQHKRRAFLRDATVAGVTAATDNLEPVYATTDNPDDLTLTRPADDALQVGFVLRFKSTGIADVWLFSPEAAYVFYALGGLKRTIQIPYNPAAMIGNTTTVQLYGAGKIIGGRHRVVQPEDEAGSTWDLQITGLDSAGVAETAYDAAEGTEIALAAVDTAGEVTALTAFEADVFFHDGDTITITVGTTGGTDPTNTDAHLILELDVIGLPET